MNIKQSSLIFSISALIFTSATNAALGPVAVYLNTEYRTNSPVIGSISSTLSFSADDIQATGANTFLDFLASVPSVGLVNAQGNVPAVFMRGNKPEHTLFLVDGISINDISSVNGAISNGLADIALSDIEKIDIIKGSGSVLYGSSAIAGVISITTKKGADGSSATLNTKFGTHNSKTYALSASAGGEAGFVRFTHNQYTTDGISVRTDDTLNDADGIDNRATQIKAGNKHYDINYSENSHKNAYDRCYDANIFAVVDLCSADRKLNKIAINTHQTLSDIWDAKLSLAQTKTTVNTYVNGLITTAFGASDNYKSTHITLLNDIKFDAALLNVGLSKVNDENTTTKDKLSHKNVFINWQNNIENMDINVGTRYIKHDEFGAHVVYNTGIGKYLNNNLKLTANYNTGFNSPTIRQVSDPANPFRIKPETSKNINLALSKQHAWGQISIEWYKNTITDLIVGKFDPITFDSLGYVNEQQQKIKGIEVSLNANISDYNINFSHNYNESRKNNETTQDLRRPKNITNLTIGKQYNKLNSSIQIIKKSSSLDFGSVKLDGYTLINLSTNYAIKKNAKLSLNINNITDKNYTVVNNYNQLGRTLEIGLTYNF
ncbi:TonB-dependent receptor plug domain-containing protein [Candidatus Thioglobus sp.]|uniref:TonB-dependent receptor plug domain-containing protein n=1 Tax=Candidatus Thioglobus sp. TaxID=2026721 RepID=UPI003D111F05